jgi:hypothetical protein
LSVKFQQDLILGRFMLITKQKLNVDHNRNMCYSGEWCEGYGIEPVVSKSFELQNLLRHEKF